MHNLKWYILVRNQNMTDWLTDGWMDGQTNTKSGRHTNETIGATIYLI